MSRGKVSLYGIIAGSSLFIRLFLLPNPFAQFENGALYNWIAEPILHIITFTVVGIFYTRGSLPALGSILYLFFYIVNVAMLMLISWLSFSWWAIVIISILYCMIILGMIKLRYSVRYK